MDKRKMAKRQAIVDKTIHRNSYRLSNTNIT